MKVLSDRTIILCMVMALGLGACRTQTPSVVALVNKTPITSEMLRVVYKKAPSKGKSVYKSFTGRRNLVYLLINQRVLLINALKEKGSNADPASLDPREQQQLISGYADILKKRIVITEREIQQVQEKRQVRVQRASDREALVGYLLAMKIGELIIQERSKMQIQIDEKALDAIKF